MARERNETLCARFTQIDFVRFKYLYFWWRCFSFSRENIFQIRLFSWKVWYQIKTQEQQQMFVLECVAQPRPRTRAHNTNVINMISTLILAVWRKKKYLSATKQNKTKKKWKEIAQKHTEILNQCQLRPSNLKYKATTQKTVTTPPPIKATTTTARLLLMAYNEAFYAEHNLQQARLWLTAWRVYVKVAIFMHTFSRMKVIIMSHSS